MLVRRGIEMLPGPQSSHAEGDAVIRSRRERSAHHWDRPRRPGAEAYELEPQLVTACLKAGPLQAAHHPFDDIPKDLVNAVIAIEDRRFFQHSGVNYLRLVEAAIPTWCGDAARKAARRSPCNCRAAFS